MIKILHIITRLDMGGSAQNTLVTCLGLNKDRYDVVLAHGLSLESNITDWERRSVDGRVKKAEDQGVKVVAIPSLVRKVDPVKDLRCLFYLWRLMKREKFAIVHTHTSKAGILGRWAAKMARVPIIIHTPHGHVFYGHFGPLASKFFLITEKVMDSVTDHIVALSEGERNDYVELSISKPHKMHTIHSGVDIDQYTKAQVNIEEKKRSLGLKPNGLIVGTVGWLLPIKGPMYLLRAMGTVWQSHPETRLLFVGKGELKEQLSTEALRMGASDRVTFVGWRDDVAEIMQILDVFVLPSLNEGMGRVLVEAMAAAKPIVASNVGGIPDLVRDGQNGLLVSPGDSDGLCVAMKKLLDDKKMRNEMGRRGRAMAQNFGVEKMVEKLDALYCSLCQTGPLT